MTTNVTTMQSVSNFKNFMALPDGVDCLDSFAGILNDKGMDVSPYLSEEFCWGENALFDIDELSHCLEGYGRWMKAKVSAFEALEAMGFKAIKAEADGGGTIRIEPFGSTGAIEGEWCRREGVIYVSYAGKVDASDSCPAGRKREREKFDLFKAKHMLIVLHEHVGTELAA